MELFDYQLDAIDNMQNGCILCGGVGSGKSLTALGYYWLQNHGSRKFLTGDMNCKMHDPLDLYIITTARKRDTLEWDKELTNLILSKNPECNFYKNKVAIDSWNNIEKYIDVKDSFFIFDEQRVVGYGKWSRSFIKIARHNQWILLSATPGDTWSDYIPVFVANGFYKNKTEFVNNHIVYSRVTDYPKIDRYIDTGRLIRLRNKILVNMDFVRETDSHHENIFVDYDIQQYKYVVKNRWNVFDDEPLKNASDYCQCLRRLVNSDSHRQMAVLELVEQHPKSIIFYNYDYELHILRGLFNGIDGFEVAEWNGHKHQPIPKGTSWAYLVQYNAGAEGWNCITTDTIIFYSQNYSYKMMQQAAGRIDRLNTPFHDLYYYHLMSHSSIDLAISRALTQKKKFNEQKYYDRK